MKYFIKGKKLVWSSSGGFTPAEYDLCLDNLTEEKLLILQQWWEYEDGVVTPYQKSDEELLSDKKSEARDLILSKYSETDQRNTLMSWDDTAISVMNTEIQAILSELHTNGKDADFSQFV